MNNRQAGRRRGRGGQRPGNNTGRPDNGNRIDNRSRGNAAQLLEKYKNLASDAQRSGDRVNTEYYLQFADHYFRVLSENRSRFEESQPRRSRDDMDEDGDDEFGYEGDFGSPAQLHQGQPQPNGNVRDDRQDSRQQDSRQDDRDDRGDRPQRRESRDDRGERQERSARRDRDQRPRYANDEGQPAAEAASPRAERPQPANDGSQGEPEAPPRRRGRPRREAVVEAEQPDAFDAAVLPPAIGVDSTPPADDEGEEARPRPRRRRTTRAAVEEAPSV